MGLHTRFGLAFMVALCGLLFRGVAGAQEAPPALYDLKAISLGLGAGYEARVREDGTTTSGPTAIAYIARPLIDFAFVARGSWNLVEGDVRVSPGIHYRFPVLGERFAAALNYDFYAVNNVPSPANEWAVGLVWARSIARSLVVGASASYGLDTHDWRPTVQLTVPLKTARN